MYEPEQWRGRTVHISGQEWLYFSGTSYLGVPHHSAFKAHLYDGLEKYGANFGGSRRSNLQIPVFDQAEAYLAERIGAEACLTLSSGTMAGQLAVKQLVREGYRLFYAPGSHPALEGPGHYFSGSMEDWINFIKIQIARPFDLPPVLVMDSVDVLYVKKTPVDWLTDLPVEYPVIVLIDDSHGFGLMGKNGQGMASELPETKDLSFIVTASLGKAFGIPGGLVAADRHFIELFRASSFFGGASPIAPAYLHAMLQCKDLYGLQLERLLERIRYFSSFPLVMEKLRSFRDYPVFYAPYPGLADFLAERNILISSFGYPRPSDPIISRIVLSAAHEQEDLDQLLVEMRAFFSR